MIEVSTRISATPEQVWALVGDPSRTGEWSPECRRVSWKRGSTGPGPGARFRGHNQLGWRRWATDGTVVTYQPVREIAWEVSGAGLPVSRWGYRIEPAQDGDGCLLVEWFEDRRGRLLRMLGPALRGVEDTDDHNRRGMEHSLQRVRAAVEA